MRDNRLNKVGIMGELLHISAAPHHIYGKELTRCIVRTARVNGNVDEVIVYVDNQTVRELKCGYVVLQGRLQTYRDYSAGSYVTFILTDYICNIDRTRIAHHDENYVMVAGYVKKIVRKKTSTGRDLIQMSLSLESAFDGEHECRVKVIAVDGLIETSMYNINNVIQVEGRLQSRVYIIRSEEGAPVDCGTYYEIKATGMEFIR